MVNKYDSYEVKPIVNIIHDNGQESMEPVEESHSDIYCWSVYGHLPTGGIECLADCPSKEIADLVCRSLQGFVYVVVGDTDNGVSVTVYLNLADAQRDFIESVNEVYAKDDQKAAESMDEAEKLYEWATDRGGMEFFSIQKVPVMVGEPESAAACKE